jgi:hypothetical protein
MQVAVIFIWHTVITCCMHISFASIDRFCARSPWVCLRRFTTVHKAQLVIIGCSIIIGAYMSSHFIMFDYNATTNQCITVTSSTFVVYRSSRTILIYLATPLIMTVFGLWTILNIRH